MTDTAQPTLVKLTDTDLTIKDSNQDVRGLDVIDKNGDEIGKVDDLMIDTDERKVRFLNISSGGFLGIGDKHFLIPVDAIQGIEDNKVQVNQERHRIAGGPTYDPTMVEQPDYWNSAYGYYGYAPFWGAGYIYPGWGRYPRPL